MTGDPSTALSRMSEEGCAPLWQRSGRTHDNRAFLIRPIRVEDAQRDREFLMHLSEESRYKRLMGACREPSPALIDRFVHVDRHGSMAFVAVVGPRDAQTIIGAVRYAAAPGANEAEFAIAVADEWQSCGVGSALLQALIEYARSQGVRRLQGLVFANNKRMLDFANRHAFVLCPAPGEYTLVEITKDL
jgi:acetyltransferase